jgi:hypothetical protein
MNWPKPSRAKQSCATCNAFVPNRAAPASGGAVQGSCVSGPPALMQGMAPVPGSGLSANGPQMMPVVQGVWPPTAADRWCRMWEQEESNDARQSGTA